MPVANCYLCGALYFADRSQHRATCSHTCGARHRLKVTTPEQQERARERQREYQRAYGRQRRARTPRPGQHERLNPITGSTPETWRATAGATT